MNLTYDLLPSRDQLERDIRGIFDLALRGGLSVVINEYSWSFSNELVQDLSVIYGLDPATKLASIILESNNETESNG